MFLKSTPTFPASQKEAECNESVDCNNKNNPFWNTSFSRIFRVCGISLAERQGSPKGSDLYQVAITC